MNKLIEFLHDKEAKSLVLGNNGFMAERYTSDTIGVWHEGKVICKVASGVLQHDLQILPPESEGACACLNAVLTLLGIPNLRVKWYEGRARIQCLYHGVLEASIPLNSVIELKVNV